MDSLARADAEAREDAEYRDWLAAFPAYQETG